MISKLSLFSVFVLITNLFSAQCISDTNNIYHFTYQSSNYEVVKENKSWQDAAECAVERGGHLAEINSQQEQDSVYHYVQLAGINNSNTVAPDGGGASYVWLGGHDHDVEGDWVWDGDDTTTQLQFWQGVYPTGGPVNSAYNNWGNEPDNFNGTQDALGLALTNWPLGVAGQWNDVNETNTLYYIIEYPNTTSLKHIDINEFHLFPNPNNGVVKINSNKHDILNIIGVDGSSIKSFSVNPGLNVIDLSDVNNGVYIISNNKIQKKIVIQ